MKSRLAPLPAVAILVAPVGGSIPVGFANMGVVNGALKFYVNLRKHVG